MNEKEVAPGFYLMTENSFHCSYLVSKWVEKFRMKPNFLGVLIRGNPSDNLPEKTAFHCEYSRNSGLTDESVIVELIKLYGKLSEAEMAMFKLFGIPPYSPESYSVTYYLGNKINATETCTLFEHTIHKNPGNYSPRLFIFLDAILSDWWIKFTRGHIINAHSAILPFARGMYAIEQVMAEGDPSKFLQCAGASIHFIDQGVDTGPLIRVVGLRNPFAFESIFEVKAACYNLAFELLTEEADWQLNCPQYRSLGISPHLFGRGPNYLSKHYTDERKHQAETYFTQLRNGDNPL